MSILSRAARRHPLRRPGANATRARLAALEAEIQEQRQLSRRVAELTDLVTELLVPIAERDRGTIQEVVERYRSTL